MKDSEAFHLELKKVVRRFRLEHDLTYSEAAGVLFIEAHALAAEAVEQAEEDEDDES